jgi:hypothetical protein
LACENNRLLLLASTKSIGNLYDLFFWFMRRKCAADRILTLLPPIPVVPVTLIGTVVVRVTGGNLLALIGTEYAAAERGPVLDSGTD